MTDQAQHGSPTREQVEDAYPLTPTQMGMLFHALSEPDSEQYFEQLRCELHGPMDVGAFRRAWEDTVAAHPPLRTLLVWQGMERPLQVVRRSVDVPFEVLDWRSGDATAHEVELDRLCEALRRRPFDLSAAPLLRLTVVRSTDETTHLIWDFHHVILDGWSTSLVFEEVRDRYERLVRDDAPPGTAPASFREYVAWLQRQDDRAAERYWSERVGDVSAPTRLVGDLPPDGDGFDLARASLTLRGEVVERLRACARAERVTMNTLVQGAWAVLLQRYLGHDDVVFGVTTSGRPAELPDVEHIVGMFLTTLPMRLDASSDRTVGELLRDAQALQLEMTEHQHASLADVQRWSAVPGGQPLFDTLLIFENYPSTAEPADRTLTVANTSVFEQTNYPFTLLVGVDEQIEVLLLHDRRRWDETAADRLLAHFARILQSFADDAGASLAAIDIMTESERTAAAAHTAGPTLEIGDRSTIGMFLDQAGRTPDRVALRCGDVTMTYDELRGAVADRAATLRAAGATGGELIGVCLTRSADMVVAVLAVQYVGGAYVPLDPSFPTERVIGMIDDAGLELLVTDAVLAERFGRPGMTIIDVGDPAPSGDAEPVLPAGDDTAYVIYTSGSTGRPKGVEVPHRALANFLLSMSDRPGLGRDDVLAAVTTLSFDIAGLELYLPLVNGATLVVVPDDVRTDGVALASLLDETGTTVLQATPATWRLLIESGWEGRPGLKMLCGGEPLGRELAGDLVRLGGELWNMYGPTETTIWSTVDRVDDPETITIGDPIANTTTIIRDPDGRLVPVGVVGELCIGGLGLATGYRNQPELTAERFVDTPDGTVYRTGDLARYRDDGRIECLGRTDHQIKVRGFRLEPGEIETRLREIEGVEEAIAVVRTIGSFDSLVAYYRADRSIDAEALGARLRRSLPDYMVPSVFVPIDTIPLTPNGKIDRAALPAPEAPRSSGSGGAPETDTERAMTAIWQRVLDTGPVDRDDDFFALGGHSLLAVRLAAQLKTEFDVNLPLSRLIDAPTVREISAAVDAMRSPADEPERPWRHLVPFGDPDPGTPKLFCVHGAGGNVLNLHDLARRLEPRWQLVGIEAAGVDGEAPLHTTMAEACAAYLTEIVEYQPDGPYFVAGYSSGGSYAYELGVRLAAAGHEVGAVVLLDTFHPRTQLRRAGAQEHLRLLRRYGWSYVTERLQGRRKSRMYALAPETIAADAAVDGTVPIEQRDAHLVANTREVLAAYEPPRFDGPVWLYTASDVLPGLRHVGPDRGWGELAANLETAPVPGDHNDFVVDPHAAALAELLRDRLDRALGAAAP